MSLDESVFESPVGTLRVVASERGLRAVLWPEERPGRVTMERWAEAGLIGRKQREAASECLRLSDNGSSRSRILLADAVEQLEEYFEGRRREFTVPLDPVGTDFQRGCWRILRGIPYGQTISYGEQARRLGRPKAARAVGAANGRNPLSIVVPCHRVVAADGALTGFGGGLETKRWLLEHERRVCGGAGAPRLWRS